MGHDWVCYRCGDAVKFGLMYNTGIYGTDPGNMAALARHAEACGFESFYVPDHPVVLAKRLATIDVLRLLWAGDDTGVSYSGEFFSFTNLCSFPKPWHATTLPVHVGGSSPPAARRAGRRGDGYFPGGRLTAAQRASQLELMRATAAEAGRDPAALEYTRWGSIDLFPPDVEAHARNGITRLVVGPASDDPAEQRAEISAFADRLSLPRTQ